MGLHWGIRLSSDIVTRAMSWGGTILPGAVWRNSRARFTIGRFGGKALGVGKLCFSGRTPNGQEYVLTNRMGTLLVTRRIRVDTKLAICRYVELFRNLGSAPAPVSLMVRTYLGNNCQAVVSDRGNANPSTLGRKECGFVTIQQGSNRPSVLFFLAAPRSKTKPTIMNSNNYDFRVTYSAVVPPGRTLGICLRYHRIVSARL